MYTVLQPFRHIEFIVHIAISVLPGTHFHLSQVKHFIVKCRAQKDTSQQCPKIERGKHGISWEPSQFGHSFSQTCKLGRTSLEKLPKTAKYKLIYILIGKMKYRLTKGRQLQWEKGWEYEQYSR